VTGLFGSGLDEAARAEAFAALDRHADALSGTTLRRLFAEDPERAEREWLEAAGLLVLDQSRLRSTPETWRLLYALLDACGFQDRRAALFAGEVVNETEQRPALHMACRQPRSAKLMVDGRNLVTEVHQELDRMGAFVDQLQQGLWRGATRKKITAVVVMGIGGSDLGPRLAVDALAPYRRGALDIRFVSNADARDLSAALQGLKPETTLFVIASKSFTTEETLTNAASARSWVASTLGEDAVAAHFCALTASAAKAQAFGVNPDATFAFADWVGGRYSLWSTIGLPVALSIGMAAFRSLLAGAHAMDRHFETAPPEANLPVRLALAGIWHRSVLGWPVQAILPYDHGLKLLPDYLQQLEMESNGKGVRRDGRPVDHGSAAVIFGSAGTIGQHSFYQQLHHGPDVVPADIILPRHPGAALPGHHPIMVSHALAQAQAFAFGRTPEETAEGLRGQGADDAAVAALTPHQSFSGNRPTQMILMDRLGPEQLGALIALYEHKVFVQSVIWDINPFDQFGVELGKTIARRLKPMVTGEQEPEGLDPATAKALSWLTAKR